MAGPKLESLDSLFEDFAAEQRAAAIRDENDPVRAARIAAKRAAEIEIGIRNGWLDANGDPIEQPETDEDETEEENEEDE